MIRRLSFAKFARWQQKNFLKQKWGNCCDGVKSGNLKRNQFEINNIMTQQYQRRKLIIDADAGIDDAMALVLALDSHKRGEVDIRAITCVNGNTTVKNSQVNVLRILDVMGCPKECPSH